MEIRAAPASKRAQSQHCGAVCVRGGLCSEEEEDDNEEDKSSVVTLLLSFSRVKMVRHERAHELLEYTEDLWHEQKHPLAAARSGQRHIRDQPPATLHSCEDMCKEQACCMHV